MTIVKKLAYFKLPNSEGVNWFAYVKLTILQKLGKSFIKEH